MIDGWVGLIFVEDHATVGANNGAGIFEDHQILAYGGAGGVEVLRQLFNRAFTLRLQVLNNGCLALTWFHSGSILSCVKFRSDNFARYLLYNEIIHVSV